MIHRDSVKDHKGNWTILHNRIAEDERLSLKAKGMLWYLLSKPPTYKVSKRRLIKELTAQKVVGSDEHKRTMRKDSRCSIETAFQELVECGYIVDENGKWHVYETPRIAKNPPTLKTGTPSDVDSQPSNMQEIDTTSADNQHADCGKSAHSTSELRIGLKEERKEDKKPSSPLPHSPKEDATMDVRCNRPSMSTVQGETVSERQLQQQAAHVLRCHPSKERAQRAMSDVIEAIKEHGYDPVLFATKSYAAEIEGKQSKPSWPTYWYKDGSYRLYLPQQPESFQPRQFEALEDMTSDMEALALEHMEDAVTAYFMDSVRSYDYSEADAPSFREAARICLYRNLNPFQFVMYSLGKTELYRTPQMLHRKEAESRYYQLEPESREPNFPCLAEYLTEELRKYDNEVLRLIGLNPAMSRDELLLCRKNSLPGWYRVVTCAPESPRLGEIIDLWGGYGRLAVYALQIKGIVEALFLQPSIHASHLFPYYAKRYRKAPEAAPISRTDAPVVPVAQIDQPLVQPNSYREIHGCAPMSRGDALAFLRKPMSKEELEDFMATAKHQHDVALSG